LNENATVNGTVTALTLWWASAAVDH